jgi:RNase P subunit RPR2
MEIELICKSCGKPFTYKEEKITAFSRQGEVTTVYLDCPRKECGETDKYEIKKPKED